MQNHHNRFPGGAGRGAPPPQFYQNFNPYLHQNPNFQFQNPNFPIQNPNFQFQNPNFQFQNPNFFPPNPNPNFQLPPQNFQPTPNPAPVRPKISVDVINQAVVKARSELNAAGEHVSAWKVSQAVVAGLGVESWDVLGVPMQQVPALNMLINTEGKINAFIHCFVAVRRITSLHDLSAAICKSESVELFEQLDLGPLVRHPLAIHYFSVSSDAREIFNITSEEIISSLGEFLDVHKGSRIGIEEFLDFAAKQRSVSGIDKLHVRIQSLGTHVNFLKHAKALENVTLKKFLKDVKHNSSKSVKKRPLMSSQKRQLDAHFSSISKRIESFSSENKDFGGFTKHIRFLSSSSEEMDSEESEDEVNQDEDDFEKRRCDQPSRCPYPSAAEERSRLGLKETDGDTDPLSAIDSLDGKESHGASKRKRGPDNESAKIAARRKLPKTDGDEPDTAVKSRKKSVDKDETDFSLDTKSMRTFIMMWKEACRVNNVSEVFLKMLEVYKIDYRRKRAKVWFSSHPFIGLLNVAVMSIARGMWDSMYDDFQDFAHCNVADTVLEKNTLYESIEVEPAKRDRVGKTKCNVKSITIDDIVQKISTYLDLHHKILSDVELTLEAKLSFLRKLCKCESWLAGQFSVKNFKSLGYGKFFIFLEKHVPLIHNELQRCLTGETFNKPTLEVCMLEKQLVKLLSQAANNLEGDKNITKEMILPLLMRQFPSVNFVLAQKGLLEEFLNDVKKKGSISTCVLFSSTLLTRYWVTVSEKETSGTSVSGTNISNEATKVDSFTSKDAIGVLLKAPMLSDLVSWTHWDIIFAPLLGPLVGWLLNEVHPEELLSVVTNDGKVIRIDPAAKVESFFEACLEGSSFKTAVQLLSLLSVYGGEANVPLSLLKSHARRAFEVKMNSGEIEINENKSIVLPKNTLYTHPHGRGTSRSSFDLHVSDNRVSEKVTIASRFFIDCLDHLPGEFQAFAADVLLYGLQSVLKDAPLYILRESKRIYQSHLLHDVGLSLGIVEWIDDYYSFASSMTNDSKSSGTSSLGIVGPDSDMGSIHCRNELRQLPSDECKMPASADMEPAKEEESSRKKSKQVSDSLDTRVSGRKSKKCDKEKKALMVIESIRREEFGLDPGLSDVEASMLKKQHARLGRALHCLSQELYSQDSHFLLELVQNADDNIYKKNVDPTLTFILQDSGIIVLNNEKGFSSRNIRALCDVGSSTKKGGTGGYIGKKGIGFKSVFRVTDAPEIHSNGFHVKFDITEGQIGFVLPTVIPPCDVDLYMKLASCSSDKTNTSDCNTCIVLPFRKRLSEDSSLNSIRSMFCDLHPSLLLFLHRLQCIRFRSIPDDTMIIMRKEVVGNGIVNVSFGKEKMTWFVASQVLQAEALRTDAQTTEISIAFTLKESGNGDYIPHLEQQPAFAFLPLRRYGLKFIIQGDFVLPSSREEVDADSPWNQWLLTKFPDLFVSAEKSFCAFPCLLDNPGKAVSLFMSFVPLVGEVQGFFTNLPRLIISKLRMSKCLLMEGNKEEWVLPCKVIRNWNEEALKLLPASYLHEHLGLGFLDRNIILSDSLARNLGVQEYGPTLLVQFMTSLCHSQKGVKSEGLVWLSSWLNALYTMLFNSSGQFSSSSGTASDVINDLRKIPFIPLADGAYSSLDEGTIWLHSNSLGPGFGNEHNPDVFPVLYAKLRTITPTLFSAAATVDISGSGMSIVDNVTRMLLKIGVQELSAHEIVKVHILPAISGDRITLDDKKMMLEYLSFAMSHLQSSCSHCHVERGHIISELREKALISTNYGFKRPAELAIHFSEEYGNAINVNKLIDGMDLKWLKVDVDYLGHPVTGPLPSGMRHWREFFQQIGVTDFVQVISVEKSITDSSYTDLKNIPCDGEPMPHGAVVRDWESPELTNLLSQLSLTKDRIKSQYLLEALDTLWDDCFSDKVDGCCVYNSAGDSRVFRSSFINCLCSSRWIASSRDEKLRYARDLFHDCEAVRSVFGANAPYAVPKLKSEKFLSSIGFKTGVCIDDVLQVLRAWRKSKTPFMASLTQMSKFYTFIWNEMATSKQKVLDALNKGPFIFCPYSFGSKHDDLILGVLLSPSEVHWHDFSDSMEQMKEIYSHRGSSITDLPLCKTLCNMYPSLHSFFVNECGVSESPHHRTYLQMLLDLSAVALPSQSAKMVLKVFLHWSDGVKSGSLKSDDVIYLKECLQKLEFKVLPTLLDKWVSLHPSFGLVCWCDDNKLKKEFKSLENIEFLSFGELSGDEQELLHSKLSVVMQTLGIPSLSEIVTREAIWDGQEEDSFKTSLLNWALPYAQRYIYNAHRDRYSDLKQSEFEFLSRLQIKVVKKLFSRNIIKGSSIVSKKQRECKCLLQENILYATNESDSHSLFMELSRLLCGVPNLHLANFLHMMTTMAESGANQDQVEFFILNSQKIPKLPDSEPIWSLLSSSSMENDVSTSMENDVSTSMENDVSTDLINEKLKNPKKKHGISATWPPVDWRTAPGFSSIYSGGRKMQSVRYVDDNRTSMKETDHEIYSTTGAIEECDPTSVTAMVVVPDSEALEDQNNVAAASSADVDIDLSALKCKPFFPSARGNLSHSTPNPQALLTGRKGEHVAYNYFSANAGKNTVKWVNRLRESGLPYDIVIEDEQKSREYIEVKATKASNKDWFHITLREWQFALEKLESYTIAHVVLSGDDVARITMFKNPVKLCQLGKLHLAVLMPKLMEEFSTAS